MRPLDPSSMRVALLAGGVSNERQISFLSGEQVGQALAAAGFTYEMIDPAEGLSAIEKLANGSFDVAFIALHGKGGEDGTIQGVCQMLGIPYTGSGVLASALSMDKPRAKAVYARAGLPVAPSVVVWPDEQYDIEAIVGVVGQKSVVKPIGDGSSVGMNIVHEPSELHDALKIAFDAGGPALVEQFIPGTEITVSVIGNEHPIALPVIEIVPHAEFYDFEVKYSPTGADHIIPARLSPEVYRRAQEYGIRAHDALGCHGMSRSDFIVDPTGECIILETNSIPGMTATSLLPDAARHAGYDFPTLCTMLIEYAVTGVYK